VYQEREANSGAGVNGIGRVVEEEIRELTGNQNLKGPRELSGFSLTEMGSHGVMWFEVYR
jgi:hypothetical protein